MKNKRFLLSLGSAIGMVVPSLAIISCNSDSNIFEGDKSTEEGIWLSENYAKVDDVINQMEEKAKNGQLVIWEPDSKNDREHFAIKVRKAEKLSKDILKKNIGSFNEKKERIKKVDWNKPVKISVMNFEQWVKNPKIFESNIKKWTAKLNKVLKDEFESYNYLPIAKMSIDGKIVYAISSGLDFKGVEKAKELYESITKQYKDIFK